ncbi:hypothetical protein RA307_27375 [Xanthobacteraceae bacterium Astr-EGSB]|uniref:hypothetical protein n=1 Tax=Astrobacterium formosum TaxID=3069710 RepID=UPI0027B10123|nr:hypothetical protein [Xanthobacteraceae bacterium Astr-EGSB]
MKRAFIFLIFGPISGSLITMLFDVQFALAAPRSVSIVSFGPSFFFGYLAGVVPALGMAVVDWLLSKREVHHRALWMGGLAFILGCLVTSRVFPYVWVIVAGLLAAIVVTICSWLSSSGKRQRT